MKKRLIAVAIVAALFLPSPRKADAATTVEYVILSNTVANAAFQTSNPDPLIATLDSAELHLEADRFEVTLHTLDAFEYQVEGQFYAGHLTEEEAMFLLAGSDLLKEIVESQANP